MTVAFNDQEGSARTRCSARASCMRVVARSNIKSPRLQQPRDRDPEFSMLSSVQSSIGEEFANLTTLALHTRSPRVASREGCEEGSEPAECELDLVGCPS